MAGEGETSLPASRERAVSSCKVTHLLAGAQAAITPTVPVSSVGKQEAAGSPSESQVQGQGSGCWLTPAPACFSTALGVPCRALRGPQHGVPGLWPPAQRAGRPSSPLPWPHTMPLRVG